MLKLAAVCSCLVLGAFGAGCGSSNKSKNDNGGGGGASSTPKTTSSSSGGGGGTATVSMKNIEFSPSTITVKKGTTVEWTNDDSVGHDVTKTGGPGADFKSGSVGGLNQGDTFKHTFTSPGTFSYTCTAHPSMKAKVVVK